MAVVTLSNEQHLKQLLTLGRIWHKDLCLRATVTLLPPSSPPSAKLSLHAVKRSTIASFASHDPSDEYSAEHHSSSDPVSQLWTGWYHMMEERGQTRIFGSHYSSASTVAAKLTLLHADFLAHKPVHIFLEDLYIADEFACDGAPANILAAAVDSIRHLACKNSPISAATVATRNPSTPTAAELLYTVKAAGMEASVDTTAFGLHKISFISPAEPDAGDVDGASAQAAADLVQRVAVAETGAGVDDLTVTPGAPAPARLLDAYAWEYPVSKVARSTTSQPTPYTALARYARVASIAFKNAASRTKMCLGELGIPPDEMLRYVAEYVGKEQAVWFAAVEDVGGLQRGVRDLSYSAFMEEDAAQGEAVSIAATVAGLRDAGRLGFADNVVEPGVAGDVVQRRLVVQADAGDGLVTVLFPDGSVVEGALADDALVR